MAGIEQATFLEVTVQIKMTPAQRQAYAAEYGEFGADQAPEDAARRLRQAVIDAIAHGSIWMQDFATFGVSEPTITDVPRCTHRCRDGKHCCGCGCRGCGYDAAPQLPGLEDEQPVGSLADCAGCDTRLVKRADGRWSPVLRVSTECPSGGGHIPQSVAA